PYLFGVTAHFGFLIFNVADPANITLEYELRLAHPADLSVSGDRVLICQHGRYSGEHPGEVLEFEVDPTDVSQTVLTQEMNYYPDCYPWGIVTDAEFAYVSCGYNFHLYPSFGDFSMKVLTIGDLHTNASVSLDPWHPNRITLVERPAGRRVYVGCFLDDLVAVINVDTPLAPTVSTTIATSDSANGMDVAGDKLYVADGVQGLTVVDNTDLDNPFVERLIPCNSGVANDVRVTDGYAVVSDLAGAVHVVDLMELTAQPQTWTHDLGNQGERLDVEGDIAAVVTHSPSCITFYDVSDPAAPEQLSSISPPPDEEYRDVKLSGSSAYAWFNHSIWSSEVQALDLSDLREPRAADSHYYYSYSSRDLEVWGPYVYLSQFEGGLRFLDMSDPYNVIALPSIVTSAYDVEVSDSLLVVAPVGSPLRIFDNSNKLEPQLISTCVGAANAYRVVAEFDSGYAFVIAAERAGIEEVDRTGLYAVDISDPAAPAAGPFLARPDLDNPVLSGNWLFVTHSGSEIIIYDTSDPDNLPEVATISCAGVQDICVRGRFLYAIASNGVLSIMELKGITID
ncbi:MAG: hypothetical protein KAU31_14945, partial [Spirochaetaceae bacterium]|nr:hypothetical protein [Spirochaetaceae bacterium]